MSFSKSKTFTITDAKKIASKVATDLKRIQRFYGKPSDSDIYRYEEEIIQLLHNGYLETVTYGFKRNGKWIEPTEIYKADEIYYGNNNDDPGKIRPGQDVIGASFNSFLTYNENWKKLSVSGKKEFKKTLPFQRSSGEDSGHEGYFSSDKTYSSGGKAINRSSLKNY